MGGPVHGLGKPLRDPQKLVQFSVVLEAIKQLIEAKEKPRGKIGFEVKEAAAVYSRRSRNKSF